MKPKCVHAGGMKSGKRLCGAGHGWVEYRTDCQTCTDHVSSDRKSAERLIPLSKPIPSPVRKPVPLLPCKNGGIEIVEKCRSCNSGVRHLRVCTVPREEPLRTGVCTWEESESNVMSCRECQSLRLGFEPVS